MRSLYGCVFTFHEADPMLAISARRNFAGAAIDRAVRAAIYTVAGHHYATRAAFERLLRHVRQFESCAPHELADESSLNATARSLMACCRSQAITQNGSGRSRRGSRW